VIEEVDSSGSAVARYTQGLGIDEPLAISRSGVTSFYHADGLGSVTSVTDGSGQVAASYTYDSFGNLTASTGTITNPFRYTAREFDSETGLYYYRARYYDAGVGRFLSEDPLRWWSGQPNFYPYALNGPTNHVDPTGLEVAVIGDVGSYVQAIMYLQGDATMATIVHDLQVSPALYTIITNNIDDDSYDPSTRTIHWDPHSALRCTSGGKQSPALGLGHEMAHAEGGFWGRLLVYVGWPGYDNLEERRVIVGPETQAARTLGEGTRTDHSGSTYTVPAPTAR
jgi:RHS repeat-associated protein